jgi:hypothetical protein
LCRAYIKGYHCCVNKRYISLIETEEGKYELLIL